MSSVYTLYSNGDNCPPCLIPFQRRNVVANELQNRSMNSCLLKDEQLHNMIYKETSPSQNLFC